MARPRQPTDLIIVKGKKHLTQEEIADRKSKEVKAPADNVQAPSYLPDELKAEFNRIATDLVDIEIMSNLDCEALARFIVAESQYQKVSIRLMKMKNFGIRYMELLKIQEKLFKQARSSASDLGLTISSRCKLVVPKANEDAKPKNKFNKFAK
ncbi:phage terminase small subunit P27 family [Priestia aryabhattai]|uniref:phage terminase small subunit P27 family n=1 Tax=Priestia aryabhattai TaxID=412384 RepID=UPI0023B0193F|nr:phage terminase small subunit P27 family [Priestia aryabhattai]MDE8676462.1 phage terminase small subunit P27 family [Priestia aryabhattai]